MALDVIRVLAGMQVSPRELAPRTSATSAQLRFQWAGVLGSATLSSVAWAISPDGPTITEVDHTTDSSQTAVATLSDLEGETEYTITCTATGSDGSIREARCSVWCQPDVTS